MKNSDTITERSGGERKRPVKRSGTFYYYICTIKRNALEHTKRLWLDVQLQRVIKALDNVEWSDDVALELDSKDRLHLHAWCRSKYSIYYKRLQRKGWHLHFRQFPIEDLQHVKNYFNKTNQNKYELEQREVESYIYHMSSPFIDC